jgi:predicted transcriptional regulator
MAVNYKASLNPFEWTGKDVVEYILLLCAGEVTFDDLMQLMILSSPTILKKYFFYLIDYDLISYNGRKRVYCIKDKGLELLSKFMMKERTTWT